MFQSGFSESDFLQRLTALEQQKRPPVQNWNPPFCGDIDMRIARDGTWYYLGSPITRKPMVVLFSSILRKEGEAYFLVTPVEKVGIRVDDAPFVAIHVDIRHEPEPKLYFTTQVDDIVLLSAENPLHVKQHAVTGEPMPYIQVRDNLSALIHRNVFYELVALAVSQVIDGIAYLGIWSAGAFFVLGEEPKAL
jgi:hypothetical protein